VQNDKPHGGQVIKTYSVILIVHLLRIMTIKLKNKIKHGIFVRNNYNSATMCGAVEVKCKHNVA